MRPNIGIIRVQYECQNQGLITFQITQRNKGFATTCRVGDSKLWQVDESCKVSKIVLLCRSSFLGNSHQVSCGHLCLDQVTVIGSAVVTSVWNR